MGVKIDREPFEGRVCLQQRVLPEYRAGFIDLFARHVKGGLKVIAGEPRPIEKIRTVKRLEVGEIHHATNQHIFSGAFYMCLQGGLLRWLNDADPDVLILEANPRYPMNYLAQRWMHQRNRPLIGWGLGVPSGGGPLSRFWRNTYLSAFDGLIAYSSKGAEQYRQFGFPAEKIFIALNAASSAPEVMPDRTAAQDQPLRIIFVGRLQARKRVDLLIQACAEIEDEPELIIVGDGPEMGVLKSSARQNYPSTQFRGPLYGSDLQQAFLNADLFVLPGTGGLALQQAMANALPVIAAEGDGTQADLVEGDNGWLVQPGNLNQMVNALEEAIENRNKLPAMGKTSFETVQRKANIEMMVNVFLQAIQSVFGDG